MGLDLEMRAYQPGDEDQILALFRHSFGRDLDRAYWAWRFQDSPAGAAVIYLAWDGDILAAHYAVTSVEVRIQGQDWPTGLSGTTMTHPDYRGLGLFPELARRTYARMAETGRAMVWGFPNALSHRGFVRDLNWVDVYEVPTLRLSLAGPLRLPAAGDGVVELAAFDAGFDDLWARVRDDRLIAVKRDSRYLRWRYAQNPAERYRILACVDAGTITGYAVFKRYREELQVVDILSIQDVDVGIALLAGVAQVAAQESAVAVSLWLNVSHPLHHALEKLGMRNAEPVTYFGGLSLQPGLPEAGLYEFKNWYLTMGDSDVF